MKILHLVEDLQQIGGREQFLAYLLPKLKTQGLKVSLAIINPKLNNFYEAILKKNDIDIYHLSAVDTRRNDDGIYSRANRAFQAIKTLKAILRKEKPDIIHSHLPVPSFIPYLSSSEIPKIATIHGPFLLRFARRKIEAWLALQIEVIINNFARTRYIAVSRAVEQNIRSSLKVPAERIRVVYNGIDLSDFKKKTDFRSKTSPVIIQIGSLTKVKGHLTSLRAFQIVKKFYPKSRLLFIGEGLLRSLIEKKIKEVNLDGSVFMLGTQNEVLKILPKADVCWIPSEWEGFSLVCLESMASGLPVIASAVGGLIELISDGETGFLIPSGSFELLANKTLTILRNPALGQKLGLAAYRVAENKFSIEKTMEGYISAYQDILQGQW